MSGEKKGSWEGFSARAYYTLGLLHYVYGWVGSLGIVGMLSSAIIYQYLPILAYVICFFSAVLAVLGIVYWKRQFERRHQGANPGLNLLHAEHTYAVLENDEYQSTRLIHAKVIRDGVDRYKSKFIWSGTGAIRVELISPTDAHAEVTEESHGITKICTITFKQAARKGDEIKVAFTLHLKDTNRAAKPFISTTVHDWISGSLTLRVRFTPATRKPLFKEIFISHVSELSIFEEPLPLPPGSLEGAWVITKPRPLHKYVLRWERTTP